MPHPLHTHPHTYSQSLLIPDQDPSGLSVGGDGYSIVTTNKEVVVAHNGQRVSSFSPSYQPVTTAFHPSQNEVAVGGKVS